MTICIAAICENKYVVIVTDRMITVTVPNIEFEQINITKAVEISDTCYAATAGSAIAFTPVMKDSLRVIDTEQTNSVDRIAKIICDAYTNNRNTHLDEQVLRTVGLNLQSFYQNNQSLNPQIAAMLFAQMQEYNYQLWVIVAGVDDSGAHIWHIENPGQKHTLDKIGFHAVGSGQDHAVSTFIANEFDPSIDLSHGLAIAYEAKRRSEKASGVGRLTDIVIISKAGSKHLSGTEIQKLNEVFDKKIRFEREIVKELDELIEKLDFLKNTD